MTTHPHLPRPQGLYHPDQERDACGFGLIANLHGHRTHRLVHKSIEILANLTHRGAAGADPETGDGAGILLQLPDAFFRTVADALGVALPAAGRYAVGVAFLAPDADARAAQRGAIDEALRHHGLPLIAARPVPTEPDAIGPIARQAMPSIWHLLIDLQRLPADAAPLAVERLLVLARRRMEQAAARVAPGHAFHLPSLSARTLVYKGLLLAHQIEHFYPDLTHESVESALAIVHQRYSTNTFPTWDLAHPFRFLAHNGEINTLRGNLSWAEARQRSLASAAFGAELEALLPVLTPGRSDSAQLDAMLELLVLSGRPLAHAIAMMIPEAWEHHNLMDPDRRAFYEAHSLLMEPWDGPAAVAFTDGVQIGAVLDRNGLRPARYLITEGGYVVLASEAGVIAIKDEDIIERGRLQPGRIFLIDTQQHRIITDEEVKAELAGQRPWAAWLDRRRLHLRDLPAPTDPDPAEALDADALLRLQIAFGYTLEDLRLILPPMVRDGQEAIGSMGDDTALACLSDRPRLVFEYFKQQFAQVTNPPIDSIRERLIMALTTTLGARGNLLAHPDESEHTFIRLERPLLTPDDLARLQQLRRDDLRAQPLDTCFEAPPDASPAQAGSALRAALERLRAEADAAVASGVSVLILSDRATDATRLPIPALLATGAVHHHLIRQGTRTRCDLVIDTGEAREIGHFALLLAYGAAAVHPRVAWATLRQIVDDPVYIERPVTWAEATQNYLHAVDKGLLKIFAKMGISTLQSYQAAQIHEIIGLSEEVVAACFPGTPSRISGVDFDLLARESVVRHTAAFHPPGGEVELDPGGLYQWRRRGEKHTFDPDVVAQLQHAVRQQSWSTWQDFSRAANKTAEDSCTLRGLLELIPAGPPIPVEEVEPATAIVRRFCTGAMSFGSISREAHETLARAMNRLGGRSNTGEGGEDEERFQDERRSAIKQVASGRFGVTSWYLVNADELQIKMAQGAKPGEGGQLPGHKVDATIARLRHSTPGVGLISPPPHHDIYSIEDLAQLIHDLKSVNPEANVSVKLVARSGVGTIAAGVAKAKADLVVISGHDGGTGASPQTSIKYAGVPWEIGLAEAQQTLVLNNLRGRVCLQVDGGLKTGRDVVVAALLGADEFGFSTAPLVAVGCILMRVCHMNTCPVGIATQDPSLRRLFHGKPEHVIHYMMFVAQEVRELMAALGFRRLEDMIGRADCLRPLPAERLKHWKAQHLDLSALLHTPDVPWSRRHTDRQHHNLDLDLDATLLPRLAPALEHAEPVVLDVAVRNIHRSIGARLGGEVSRRFGATGLPDDTLRLHLHGTAGQSLGAFAPRGLTFDLEGQANDYVGKGLSGGRIIVRPPRDARFEPHANVIIGNVALYGATSGELFANGRAGERFAVRNSGATAVVEGIGDHGCEYMTGGLVLILGPTGRNFAAGMSGGLAFVFDERGAFAARCNTGMVQLDAPDDDDQRTIRRLLRRHLMLTQSPRARLLLDRWAELGGRFVRVTPLDWLRHLREQQAATAATTPPAPTQESAHG